MHINSTQSILNINGKVQNLVLICYGNILRSQVLEQYLRYYSSLGNINIELYSAGVAGSEEFPDKEKLFTEIRQELNKRNIPFSLHRNPWSNEVEERINFADIIICADKEIRKKVLERMNSRISEETVYTFYGIISEGEKDFEDTYDYENNRQDPIRFQTAFDELDRIAKKMLSNYDNFIE